MDRCSYFIQNKALFGSYPDRDTVNELRENGVRIFIDVTNNNDNLDTYTPYLDEECTYLKYPIEDRSYPSNTITFIQFLLKITSYIDDTNFANKIYVHCKGGHGRAGLVVASLLCLTHNMSPELSLQLTTECHSNRLNMKDKWRIIGSPQTRSQKVFIFRLFKELFFFRNIKNSLSYGLSTFSEHPITLPNIGTFPSAECAYHALKDPHNDSYINKLKNSTSSYAKKVAKTDFKSTREKIAAMKKIFIIKINTYPEIKQVLLNTNLRPIIFTGKDPFWGGENMIGKIWMDIRFKLIKDYKE